MSKKDNPKAFKHWIGPNLLGRMSDSIEKVYPTFDRKKFTSIAVKLQTLELKPRVRLIRDQLHSLLPQDFKAAVNILLDSLQNEKLTGFDLWPYTEFVQEFGLKDVETSLDALTVLTQKFTSEFAVRPFIKKSPRQTLSFLSKCASSSNVHLRRWASEGSRPRLPWGEKLGDFIQNPRPTLPILEKLKHDSELYVRKSVSNHLNDIAKDHPDVVIDLLKKWKAGAGAKHQAKIDWIIRRSLRTLIKDGHPKALQLIGADPRIQINLRGLKLNKKEFKMGEHIDFEFEIQSSVKKSQKLVVDYIVHHRKANQTTSAKVFKLKTFTLEPASAIKIQKKHSIKPITTRKYYSGQHILEIQVNGRVYGSQKWDLRV